MDDITITRATTAMMQDRGADYTAGFLVSQLNAALQLMPKTKQKMFLAQFRSVVGATVKVKVKNLMTGAECEIPWDQQGGPCDPSMERYWSM